MSLLLARLTFMKQQMRIKVAAHSLARASTLLPLCFRVHGVGGKGSNIRHAHISKWVAFVQRAATTHDGVIVSH